MDSTQRSKENSNSEKDAKEMITNENSSATRSYNCAFCKRGFTNAQALGGHMNIHRKDKAKKKKLGESSASHMASECFAPLSSSQAQFAATLSENNSYQMFSSSPNPSYPHDFSPQRVSSREILTPRGDFMESNLSLSIGLPVMEERRDEIKREDHGDTNRFGDDHVDLELRLGQNP